MDTMETSPGSKREEPREEPHKGSKKAKGNSREEQPKNKETGKTIQRSFRNARNEEFGPPLKSVYITEHIHRIPRFTTSDARQITKMNVRERTNFILGYLTHCFFLNGLDKCLSIGDFLEDLYYRETGVYAVISDDEGLSMAHKVIDYKESWMAKAYGIDFSQGNMDKVRAMFTHMFSYIVEKGKGENPTKPWRMMDLASIEGKHMLIQVDAEETCSVIEEYMAAFGIGEDVGIDCRKHEVGISLDQFTGEVKDRSKIRHHRKRVIEVREGKEHYLHTKSGFCSRCQEEKTPEEEEKEKMLRFPPNLTPCGEFRKTEGELSRNEEIEKMLEERAKKNDATE